MSSPTIINAHAQHNGHAVAPLNAGPPLAAPRPPAAARSKRRWSWRHQPNGGRPPAWLLVAVVIFWIAVLSLAAFGSITGAEIKLHMPWAVAILPVLALELGGVVLSAVADWRREQGERAIPARVASAAVASGAVAWNLVSHWNDPVQAGFFAAMSLLGYAVYLIWSGAKRRDALRVAGKMEETTPAYGWLRVRHPRRTAKAREMFRRDPSLGLHGSLDAAEADEKMTAYLRLRLLQDNTPEQTEGILLALDPKTVLPLLRERMREYRVSLVDAMASELSAKNILGTAAQRAARQRLTGPRMDVRELTAARRRPNRPDGTTKGAVGRPSKHPSNTPVQHTPLAVSDAAAIRARYPNGLPPDRGAQRMVRDELGWHPTKATNALNAYRAEADLTSEVGRLDGQPT